MALHVPERTMSRLIDESEALLHQLPGTYDALWRGVLSYRHAQVIVDQALSVPTESRTLTQLIADVALDLLENGEPTLAGATQGIRPTVLVTVPALALLGIGDEPATLEGCGPIDADTARHLAARAPSFFRLLTHPETGTVLSVGRDRYEVPARQPGSSVPKPPHAEAPHRMEQRSRRRRCPSMDVGHRTRIRHPPRRENEGSADPVTESTLSFSPALAGS